MLDRIRTLLGLTPSMQTNQRQQIPAELAALNDGGLDWQIYRYDGWMLTLAACNSLAYGHSLELRFQGASFIRCPTTFDCPRFRAATMTELAELEAFLDLTDETAYYFDAQASNTTEPVPFVVCAESFSVHQVSVSYVEQKGG